MLIQVKIASKYLNLLVYIKGALSFQKTNEIELLYYDIQRAFKHFCMLSSEFFT